MTLDIQWGAEHEEEEGSLDESEGFQPQTEGKVQFSSVAQSRPTLCNPMDCTTPGLPVHQQLPEPTQTHVH